MNIRFFEGPAGSGKTTRLMEELATILVERPLSEHERVLALTKMHGSRRRLRRRLLAVSGLHRRFECVTVDSLAWRILSRWQSLGRLRFGEDTHPGDYDEICRRAGALLNEGIVRRWVTNSFPILIVDEMQDSKGGQLRMVQGLSERTICLAAADDYQDLDGEVTNPAVAWAREHAEVVLLTQNHRTNSPGLLEAARSLREGRSVPANGGGFTVLGAGNHNVGASFVSHNLTWWRQCDDIAVITPVGSDSAPFVRQLISRVEAGPIGKDTVGPHRVRWEVSQEDEQAQFLAQLGLPADSSATVYASQILRPVDSGPSGSLDAWLDKQRRIAGRTTFTVAEIHTQVRLIHQRTRAHRRTGRRGVRAMTIHQAKNREFHSVIVLWPYQVQGSPERLRRLLYNAVTRAKRRALVVVQNRNRLDQPPFTANG